MSSDFRFHIASLAAIFLALGLGILIGTAFVGAPVVERQHASLQRLAARQDDLERERRQTEQNERALRILLPWQVAGKLAGRSVLLVRTGDDADAQEQAAQALRLAGASVAAADIALPRGAWQDLSAEARATDAARLARLLLGPLGTASAALDEFRRRGLILGDRGGGSSSGEGVSRDPRGGGNNGALAPSAPLVVLVGGAFAAAPGPRRPGAAAAAPDATEGVLTLVRQRDLAMAASWQEAGATVVGVESLGADLSFMRIYQSGGLATIDNIDRAAGQISLPFALRGEKAAYGMKPTADRVLPLSLERPVAAAQ